MSTTTAEYLPMPPAEGLSLTEVLDALADPLRLEIVRELDRRGELNCKSLALPVAASTKSHHLRTLREAGVTKTRAVGTQRLVSLRRAELDARFPGLVAAVLAAAGS